MFYSQSLMVDIITCQQCHKVYSDPRIFPCGHTLCNACIGKSTDPHSQTATCHTCTSVHAVPPAGFIVCQPILRLLQTGPSEIYRGERVRFLSDQLRTLKTEFDVETARHRNGPNAIKAHCDQLRTDLGAHEEAVQAKLRACSEELFDRIAQYETECVGMFEACGESTQNRFYEMRGEFERFNTDTREYLNECELDGRRIEASIEQLGEFMARLRSEQVNLSSALFNNKQLELEKNLTFFEFDPSLLATLSYRTINEALNTSTSSRRFLISTDNTPTKNAKIQFYLKKGRTHKQTSTAGAAM
jgi:hypothetical protein